MKLRAFILFICAAIYITETAEVGYMNCSMPAPEAKASCCMSQKKCPRSNHSSSKEDTKDCNNTANCSNCPLCYTAIFPAADLPSNVSGFYKRQYAILHVNYNSLFCGESWKPPDVIWLISEWRFKLISFQKRIIWKRCFCWQWPVCWLPVLLPTLQAIQKTQNVKRQLRFAPLRAKRNARSLVVRKPNNAS